MCDQKDTERKRPFVYVPDNADVNLENTKKDPPKTKYEKRKKVFNRDAVNEVVKGKYGNERKNR